MKWDQALIDGLDAALNESDVRGFCFDPSRGEARLLLEVCALPATGPVDPDLRRVILMSGVSRVNIILKADGAEPGPALPLTSLDALQAFFDSLTFTDSMYGWSFLDTDTRDSNGSDGEVPTGDVPDGDAAPTWWSGEPSLTMRGAAAPAEHTLHWFTECGNPSGRYFLGGIVAFTDMTVQRADSTPIPLTEFAADGVRWWTAFTNRDRRVSGPAQEALWDSAVRWWPDRRSESTILPAAPAERG